MLNIWPLAIPNAAQEGFSALISSLSLSADAQLKPWTAASPYFNSGNLDAAAGNYTVPATGRYSIAATVSYTLNAAITISLGAGITPSFIVRRSAPSSADLISGLFPLLNIAVTVLSLRAVLGAGTVALAGEAQLNAGDTVGLYYAADGMTLPLNIESAVWSVNRIP
ncbi:hypothetical protein ACRQV7_00350 [Caproiciproducens sp. R2]|uniref:hypothetical protein n=1 Tax=Caproiciproducens sp. R2 TaxID=3435187 RepID=UPI004034B0C1